MLLTQVVLDNKSLLTLTMEHVHFIQSKVRLNELACYALPLVLAPAVHGFKPFPAPLPKIDIL